MASAAVSARRRGVADLAVAGVVVAVVATVLIGITTTEWDDTYRSAVRFLPLALIGLLLLPVLVWVAQRPQRGVLLLAGTIPFYGLLLIVPGKPPFAEGWKEGLALFTLGCTFLRDRTTGERRPWPKVVQPMMAYLAVGVLSAIFIAPTVQGIVGIKVDFFWMLLALCAWRCPLDAADRDRLVSTLMAVSLVTSVYGLAQQFIGAERLAALGYEYNSTIRFTGRFVRSFSSMATPFNFAFFLATVLIFVVPVCLDEPRRARNTAYLVLSPVVLAALAFTFVRGAWMELGIAMLYLAIRKYKVLLLLVPIALVAVLFLPGSFSSSAFSNESLADRQSGWSQNLDKALSRPFGNGIGTTGASGEKASDVRGENIALVYEPDNQYYKAVYELGVLGLWMLVFLGVSVFLEARRAERRLGGLDRTLAGSLGALVLGSAVAAAVSTWMEIFPNDVYLWLLLAVVVTAPASPWPSTR